LCFASKTFTFATQARGSKQYELTDHLGNIRTVVPDIKEPLSLPQNQNFRLPTLTLNNYYPYGMLQAGRSKNAGGYRFGFNGMEQTKGVQGDGAGTFYDYKNRDYDPWIIRFKRTDALEAKYPFYSPYQFAGNKPINSIDLDGLEEFIVISYHTNKQSKAPFRTVVYQRTRDSVDPSYAHIWEKYHQKEYGTQGVLYVDVDERYHFQNGDPYEFTLYDPGSGFRDKAAYEIRKWGWEVEWNTKVTFGPQAGFDVEVGSVKAEVEGGGHFVVKEFKYNSANNFKKDVFTIESGATDAHGEPLNNVQFAIFASGGLTAGGGVKATLSGPTFPRAFEHFNGEAEFKIGSYAEKLNYDVKQGGKVTHSAEFGFGASLLLGIESKISIKETE
jgi:RHS repeat-associated protein